MEDYGKTLIICGSFFDFILIFEKELTNICDQLPTSGSDLGYYRGFAIRILESQFVLSCQQWSLVMGYNLTRKTSLVPLTPSTIGSYCKAKRRGGTAFHIMVDLGILFSSSTIDVLCQLFI